MRAATVAIPTYFMAGTRPLPSSIQTRLQTSPELVKNLVFLGKAGTLSTDGITIGFVGGIVTEDVDAVSNVCNTVFFCASNAFLQSPEVSVTQRDIDGMLQSNILVKSSLQQDTGNTLADIRNANKTPLHQRGIDLLLLATPPPDITTFSKNAPASASESHSVPSIASVITAARPRYILWSAQDNEVSDGQSAYWEREPFGWDSTGKHKEDRFTRAVKLDTFGGPKGAKKVSNKINDVRKVD